MEADVLHACIILHIADALNLLKLMEADVLHACIILHIADALNILSCIKHLVTSKQTIISFEIRNLY